MTRPQQLGLIPELAKAAEDGQITAQDLRQFADAAAGLLVAAFVVGLAGRTVRSMMKEALGPEQKKAIRPALDAMLPQTGRGELLVRYTGGPQRFAFPEGLEGEIRNFAGHQWVILDTLRNREVIRKSRQWTIARQQPPHLRQRSPGLLPATTYTAEEIFRRAKELFGTTASPNEAGYILPDGTMLDFSGRHYEPTAPISGPFRERMADHREIAFAWPEDNSPGGLDAMAQVMNWGAVRFSTFHETVVVNLVKPPTEPQIKAIKQALWYNPDAVLVVEVDTPYLDQVDYQEFTHPFSNWRAFIERTIALRQPTGLGHRAKVGPLPQTSLFPQAQRKDIDTLDQLIQDKQRDLWPPPSLSDARKAVYRDILNGFGTVQEAKEYVEDMPEDSVIFTAQGDEISFTLIKLIITDIERNPWLSPFKPERPQDISWQPPLIPETRITYYTVSFQGDTTFKPGEIVSEQAFKAENERVTKLGLRSARGWVTSKGELLSRGNGWRPVKELEEYLPASIPRDDLTRIADKYGWWAAKLAQSVCPHNDVACVEREARRLAEARRARLE